MKPLLIHDALIINEGRSVLGSVLVMDGLIRHVFEGEVPSSLLEKADVLEAHGCWLLPGVIDDHVHFREPGLTHKADLRSETMAALAGGVTSFMEMPNTKPQTTTLEAWEAKMALGEANALANYAFYLGATNDNLEELLKADFSRVCGVKVFMGSSTGNMLVDNEKTLVGLFKKLPSVVAVHAESEGIIAANKARYMALTGGVLPVSYHPLIRTAEACYASAARAVELASAYDTRLHLLHLSTEKEISLLSTSPLTEKRITGEACVSHLWFDETDYAEKQTAIKCNPAIKSRADRDALRQAVAQGRIDVVATDHAPHVWSEKEGDALTAASGMPGVQFSLPLMLDLAAQGVLTKEQVVARMCHAPALLYRVVKRGFIREGYYADLVLVDPKAPFTIDNGLVLSKCGWSPYRGLTVQHRVRTTVLNGVLVYDEGRITGTNAAKSLKFET
ncbi:MAG: dihydroorotase [Bacteroidales bacterium]|nr:dihydroorotase [Bacteroidales bacterium]